MQQDERRQNAQNHLDFREGEFWNLFVSRKKAAGRGAARSTFDVRHNLKIGQAHRRVRPLLALVLVLVPCLRPALARALRRCMNALALARSGAVWPIDSGCERRGVQE